MQDRGRITERELQDFVRASRVRLDRHEQRHDATEKGVFALEGRAVKMEDDIMKLYQGFPAADPASHRRYHDLVIRKTEEIRRLRIAIQEKTISALVWIAIVFTCKLLWQHGVEVIDSMMGALRGATR